MTALPRTAPASRRHSRRSSGANLDFGSMSVTPLTTTTLTTHDFPLHSHSATTHAAAASHPPPRPRRRPSSYIQGLSAPTTPGILSRNPSFTLPPPRSSSDLPKSKSASHLHYHMGGAVNDWAYRTGAALTSEARESKGQSWLVSRESSTSLVGEGEEEARFYSVGAEEYGTPMWGREGESEDTWSGELEGDEEDVDLRQGFGLGQFIDRLVGWSLFVDESDEEGEEEEDAEELEGAKMGAEKNRLAERRQEPGGDGSRNQYEEKDDWHDPSWIFDLASKIVF